jgi:redox-sensitive bicupin YhaK (pirin superfamily)
MIEVRRSEDRGHTRTDWLDSRHTFSFGDYRDPAHMGFHRLRVINDDVVAPEAGFGMHPHRDMEILTFMHRGVLEHRDSMGNGSVIRPGDVQRMSAGTGVRHSEFNPSAEDETRFLQVWIEPAELGLEPSYEQRSFPGPWRLVASRDGRDESLTVAQDVDVYQGRLDAGDRRSHVLRAGRHAWIQVAFGDVLIAGHRLTTGDAVRVSEEANIDIDAITSSHVLLFDLA